MLSKQNYRFKPWGEYFEDGCVKLSKIQPRDDGWRDMMHAIKGRKLLKKIEPKLEEEIANNMDIYPYPELLFNAFEKCKIEDVRVVFIGQDPYHTIEAGIPHAMGLSFSVPIGLGLTTSLNSIFENQLKYKTIYRPQPHGNLELWAIQGCLMLNTALTVRKGSPKSHSGMWNEFTNRIVKFFADEFTDIVFVLWGADAYEKMELIELKYPRQHVIVTSHPSGLGCNSTMKGYPPFSKFDHFNLINKYAVESEEEPINWQLY